MSKNLGTIVSGLVAFAGGVLTGLLMSPKSGKENREWIQQQSGEAKEWVEGQSHKLLDESERRIDQLSEGIKKTVKENLPDLYEATESFKLDDDDVKDA